MLLPYPLDLIVVAFALGWTLRALCASMDTKE